MPLADIVDMGATDVEILLVSLSVSISNLSRSSVFHSETPICRVSTIFTVPFCHRYLEQVLNAMQLLLSLLFLLLLVS